MTDNIEAEMAAHNAKMEELRKNDPVMHDLSMIFAKYSQGAEIQREAFADLLNLTGHFLSGRGEIVKREEADNG